MRFVTATGVIQKARRWVSNSGSVQEDEVKNPTKLAEVIRQLQKRVSDLEAITPPEPIEFEVNLSTDGAIVTLAHNFGSAVRWYVTQWTQIGGSEYPVSGPMLVQDVSSSNKVLALRSYVAGHAVIRVEQATSDIDPGTTVVSGSPGPSPFAKGYIIVVGVTFAAGVAQDVTHNLGTTNVGYFSIRNYGTNVANMFGENGVAAASPTNQTKLVTTLASKHDILFFRR